MAELPVVHVNRDKKTKPREKRRGEERREAFPILLFSFSP